MASPIQNHQFHDSVHEESCVNGSVIEPQMLAWMWCIVFSMWMGSMLVFGVSTTVHAILLCGVCITVGVFETAQSHLVQFSLRRAKGGDQA